MNNHLTLNLGQLRQEFDNQTPVQVLVFGCLCTERVISLIRLWDMETYSIAREALNISWKIAVDDLLPAPSLQLMETLDNTTGQLIIGKTTHFDYEVALAQQAMMAIVSLLHYCHRLDNQMMVTVASSTYTVLLELERVITVADGSTYHQQFRTSDMESSASVQNELNTQSYHLSVINDSRIDWELITSLRHDGQNYGAQLFVKAQQFIQGEHLLWQRNKKEYRIGEIIRGVIEDLLIDGVVVRIKHRVFGGVPSNEFGIQGLGLRKFIGLSIQGRVKGYDDIRRLLLIESIKITN